MQRLSSRSAHANPVNTKFHGLIRVCRRGGHRMVLLHCEQRLVVAFEHHVVRPGPLRHRARRHLPAYEQRRSRISCTKCTGRAKHKTAANVCHRRHRQKTGGRGALDLQPAAVSTPRSLRPRPAANSTVSCAASCATRRPRGWRCIIAQPWLAGLARRREPARRFRRCPASRTCPA